MHPYPRPHPRAHSRVRPHKAEILGDRRRHRISYLGTVLQHASAVYGYTVPTEQLRLGRAALVHLGLIAKANERSRRPTQDELDRIMKCFDHTPGYRIPMSRIVKFAVATAMRQEEITRILGRTSIPDSSIVIRQRKHPRQEAGQRPGRAPRARIRLDAAVVLLGEQAAMLGRKEGVIFPYNPRSIGHAFRRVCATCRSSTCISTTFGTKG